MPTVKHYWMFAIVTTTVCVPFFILIGSLNTNKGMHFWRSRTKAALTSMGSFFSWLSRGGRKRPGLISVKSFDSQTTASSVPLFRSGKRDVTRGRDVEDPVSREEQQKRLEDGQPVTSRSRTLFAEICNTMPAERTSTIATMWRDERKRRLTYSEEV